MKTSILNSPFARLALRSLGMAPLEREFSLSRGFSEARRLLFVDSGRLCDLVFFLPVMQALHREQPELELQVMVEDRWAELLRREAMLSGLLVYKTDQLKARSASYYRLLKEVRNREFDTVILLGDEADPPRDLVAYASQAALRIGVFREERDQLLNCMLRWQGHERYHMELAWELSRFFRLDYDPSQWRFTLRPEEQRAADQLIHFRKPVKDQVLIAVDPGRGLGERRLARGNLAYLVNHLTERLRGKVLLLHLDEDADAAAEFRRDLRGEALDMPPQGLRERLALLSRCDLLVAGNTEFFHAAVAAGVPSLGLFSAADSSRWEPRRRERVGVLRGQPGQKMSLREIDAAVEGILHVQPS
ncbi:MAG: glycosyltransferase family 9 protein [Candidatus Krumholzibacteriia bacterium]|nr:glycosyltransferase family 9 protein [bacterium]MCB9515064.1 glycosyltransferase family 9 protein [Candidatus Latescibacterota bacterium]